MSLEVIMVLTLVFVALLVLSMAEIVVLLRNLGRFKSASICSSVAKSVEPPR